MPSFGTPSGTTVPRSMDHGSGLLSRMGMDNGLGIIGVSPNHGGVGLGPRTVRVGGVDSFGGSFDWGRTSTQAPISS